MQRLAGANRLMIKQDVEWGEVVTGLEMRNHYVVSTNTGDPIYTAAEEGGSTLTRWFLKQLRPFTINIRTFDSKPILSLRRPFRFYFHEIDILTPTGERLGSIRRQFSILRRKYTVRDDGEHEILRLFGPILHPWTFEVYRNEQQIGKITKKWSGLLKEAYTDADNFGVIFPTDLDLRQKCLLLGAVFLIDFVHFEYNARK